MANMLDMLASSDNASVLTILIIGASSYHANECIHALQCSIFDRILHDIQTVQQTWEKCTGCN
jgi:hypothetical protein